MQELLKIYAKRKWHAIPQLHTHAFLWIFNLRNTKSKQAAIHLQKTGIMSKRGKYKLSTSELNDIV